MVDAIISFAVERLGDHLIREAVLLHGVKDEVVWLKDELDLLRSFLQDAEEKQNDNERIRTWVSQMRDIAYDAEDVIDTFIVKTKSAGTSKTELVSNFIMKCSCVTSMVYLHDIGKKIEALKVRIGDLSRQRKVYGIKNIDEKAQEGTSGQNTRLRLLRRTTSYAEEEHDVVGFKDDTRLLEAKLSQGEPQRSVISIFGMGGLGKTTLARKLYNNDAIKSRFDQHAWVCASQDWTTRDILERIVKSFKNHSRTELEGIEKMNDEDLERYARELLEGRRYFVVIDDVWDTAVWETLRRAFPDNKNGSRIIITTRSEAVAEFSGQRTYVHKLPFLQPDESWELFCKKALPTGETSFEGDIEQLGREMVAKCGGLPLAIVVLGGLLSGKESHEWHTVKDHIWWELKNSNNSLHISALLSLSYNDLPSYLKPCFLYLSHFPEDFVFNKERLIRLWIAEGFISQGEFDLEEVAEKFVKELVGRSLIQVVQGNWRSKIATCRVHDLLRDLAVNKARELKFLHIYDENTNFTTMYSRRLAFHSEPKRRVSIDKSDYRVRTLSSHPIWISEKFLSIDQMARFRLLTVLNLGQLRVSSSLVKAIGKLIHLRYLGFRAGGRNLVLPKTFANLQALQTLDFFRSNNIVKIPKWISKLKCLRHILGEVEVLSHKSLRKLTNIRTLKYIVVDKFRKELGPIGELINLQVLEINSFERGCVLSIEPLLKCRHLLELKVNGDIESLPEEMHKSLPNLKRLSLFNSELKQDPIPILQMFPNLVFLELKYIESPVLEFTSQGFPQLQALIVEGSNNIKQEVRIMDEGAMPKLRAISIPSDCRHSLPEGLSSLPPVHSLNWNFIEIWNI